MPLKLLYLITFQVVITLTLLYLKMSYSALFGACVFLIVMPVQFIVARIMSSLEKQTLVCIILTLITIYGYESNEQDMCNNAYDNIFFEIILH